MILSGLKKILINNEDRNIGYFIEANVQYPQNLGTSHNLSLFT